MLGTVEFTYNGSKRIVNIHKETDTFIQGENVHVDAEIPFATYSKGKMAGFVRLSGPAFITPKKINEMIEELHEQHRQLEKSLATLDR